MCFRCPMFSLSGPCELLLSFCCIGLVDLSCGAFDVIYFYSCVALLMDLFVLYVACL